MATKARIDVPGWYWFAAAAALLFETVGCSMYVMHMTMTPAQFAALPQAQQDVWNNSPGWVPAAYAVAVWSGFAGAVGLLLRQAWAQPFFVLSLVGVVVQFGTVFAMTDILSAMPFVEAAGLPIVIFAVTLLLIWFSGRARARGWIA